MNASNNFFGEAQLAASLTSYANKNTKALTELLIGELKRFSTGTEQADDITILALQYKNSTGSVELTAPPVHLKLLNQITELEKLVAKVEELAEAWNIPVKVVMEINLVLEELFTNIVFYAFDDKLEHHVNLEFKLISDHLLQMRLEDEGKPFNLLEKQTGDVISQPLDERQIGGLGIHFAKEMMKSIEYERSDNKNIVILTKIF